MDTPTRATRAGWRTSEFWLSLLGLAATVVAPQVVQHNPNSTAIAIVAGAVVGAYNMSRGIVKAAAINAGADSSSSSPTS